ncbi:hypothetical protein JOE11_003705 [Robbsia andropogonis]|uniref:tail fiber assembly protein n=1 Tax=Robbsia andropogonis TaxID=28092 RepID=UPI00209F655D|nr:tail fiber assembly protein [Robbsia andropogonis]MCP1116938.1 tail assembly chaperone [Robbsia andropogonis]MCP1126383.1 tail assembly chaperone [Robbsia andropogonis]
MLTHHYDASTGQYLSSSLPTENPVKPGDWLVPASATLLALPERMPHTWPFFRNNAWTMLPDYRGQTLYRCDNGARTEILRPGVSPVELGLTDQPRPSEMHVWVGDKWVPDPAIVRQQQRDKAATAIYRALEVAHKANLGKADAMAAGLLDEAQIQSFKVWSAYQLALVRELDKPDFPDNVQLPDAPVSLIHTAK